MFSQACRWMICLGIVDIFGQQRCKPLRATRRFIDSGTQSGNHLLWTVFL